MSSKFTVDKCLKNIKSRFDLVNVAAKKARGIMINNKNNSDLLINNSQEKATLIALKEISEGNLNILLPNFDNNDEE